MCIVDLQVKHRLSELPYSQLRLLIMHVCVCSKTNVPWPELASEHTYQPNKIGVAVDQI